LGAGAASLLSFTTSFTSLTLSPLGFATLLVAVLVAFTLLVLVVEIVSYRTVNRINYDANNANVNLKITYLHIKYNESFGFHSNHDGYDEQQLQTKDQSLCGELTLPRTGGSKNVRNHDFSNFT
jgi:hypothetical protein